MVDRSPSFALIAILTIVAIVVAGIGAGLLYEFNHPKAPAGPPTVQVGDNVTVNYIGMFGSGPEQGRVFDTSIKSVAENNATWPKSLQYTPRSASGYTPLPVHVGPNTPGSGYTVGNVTYGGVVTGFWEGLLGLAREPDPLGERLAEPRLRTSGPELRADGQPHVHPPGRREQHAGRVQHKLSGGPGPGGGPVRGPDVLVARPRDQREREYDRRGEPPGYRMDLLS